MFKPFNFSRKYNNTSVLFFILYLLITLPLKAQNNNSVNNQLWGELYVTHTFNNQFRINPQISYRRLAGDPGWKQYVFNPDLNYTWNDFINLRGGVFFQYTEDPTRKLFEIRPWQGVMLFFPRIKGFFIQHYLRLEERFIYKVGEDGSTNSTRFRYYIQAFIPINNHNIVDHTFYVWPGMEFFMELSGTNIDRIVDRTRYHLGVGYRFSKYYRFEFCYMQQGMRADNNTSFTTTDRMFRFVNRITIF